MNTDRFEFRAWDTAECRYEYEIQYSLFDYYIDDDRYVIEQCTGIKDESGNLIYEGDIVKFSFIDEVDTGNFGAKARIKYIGKGKIIFESGFVLINLKTNYKLPCFDEKLRFIKIIGNVNESPELLETKE